MLMPMRFDNGSPLWGAPETLRSNRRRRPRLVGLALIVGAIAATGAVIATRIL